MLIFFVSAGKRTPGFINDRARDLGSPGQQRGAEEMAGQSKENRVQRSEGPLGPIDSSGIGGSPLRASTASLRIPFRTPSAPDPRVSEPGDAGSTLQHHLGLPGLAHSRASATPVISAAAGPSRGAVTGVTSSRHLDPECAAAVAMRPKPSTTHRTTTIKETK
jgi:hypothetical protein